MSYVSSTSSRDLWAFFGALAAVMVALQVWTKRERVQPGELVAECADGSVIGVRRNRVLRREGRTPAQRDKMRASYPTFKAGIRAMILNRTLDPGELSLVRLRRGGDEEDAWVIESLSADRQNTAIEWGFDDETGARAVLDALNRLAVRPPVDANGMPVEVTEAELDAAIERERLEEQQEEHMGQAPA